MSLHMGQRVMDEFIVSDSISELEADELLLPPVSLDGVGDVIVDILISFIYISTTNM